MRITQEADYALRIVCTLAKHGDVLGSGTIASLSGVTERFTIKILRKLVQGGLVGSRKGVKGGYELLEAPEKISMLRVVELISGPLEISRCLDSGYECTKNGSKKNRCAFHLIFAKINKTIAERLSLVTMDAVIAENFDINELLKKL